MTYTLRSLGVLAVLYAVSPARAEPVGKGPWPLAKTEGPKVEILAYDNGDVSPWIEFFTFDSPKHPKIVQFRLNSGDWEDVPKTNTRDFTGRLHGWGLDRFSVEGKPGVYHVAVRVIRHDGSTGPVSSVKFRVE